MSTGLAKKLDVSLFSSWTSVLGTPLAQGIGVTLLFLLVEPLWFQMATNPESIYENWSMLTEALSIPRQLLALVFCLVVAGFSFHRGWPTSSGYCMSARLLVATAILCLTWAFSTYSYNFWYCQWHAIERVLLVVLGFAAIWRPAFLCIWVFLLSLIVGQFSHPLNYSWTDKVLLIEFVYLAAVFQVLNTVFPKLKSQSFIFATLVLWAAFYFTTGVAKLRIDWFTQNVPENIVFGAWYQNGWLGFLGEQGVQRLMDFAGLFGGGLKAIVFMLELGAILMLFSRRIATPVLLGLSFMHVAIFVLTGICFWKWFILDIALVVALYWIPDRGHAVLNRNSGLAAIGLVVVFMMTSSRLVWLGWYDSNLAFRYTVVAIGENGREYQVPAKQLAPYDLPFAQGRFYHVTNTPQLVDCLGATQDLSRFHAVKTLADQLSRSPQPQQDAMEGISKLRGQYGNVRYDTARAQSVDVMLEKWLVAHNDQSLERAIPFASPKHIWTVAHEDEGLDELPEGQPVRSVELRLSEALHWDGGHVVVLRKPALPMQLAEGAQKPIVR